MSNGEEKGRNGGRNRGRWQHCTLTARFRCPPANGNRAFWNFCPAYGMEYSSSEHLDSCAVLCCVVPGQRERERERRGRNFCTHSQSHRPMFDKRPRRATGVSLFGSWRNSCAVMLALPMQMAAPVSSYTSIDTVASTFSALVVCVCVCVCVWG